MISYWEILMWKCFVVFLLAFGLGCVSSFEGKPFQESVQAYDTSVQPMSKELQFPLVDENKDNIPNPTEGRFFMPTSRSDKEVIDFFNRFRRAVEIGDKMTVATMIDYPVCVEFAHGDENRKGCRPLNRASFLKNYDKIFDNDYKQFILNIDTDKNGQLGILWSNWRGVTADRGQFLFEGICGGDKMVNSELKFTLFGRGFFQSPYDPTI